MFSLMISFVSWITSWFGLDYVDRERKRLLEASEELENHIKQLHVLYRTENENANEKEEDVSSKQIHNPFDDSPRSIVEENDTWQVGKVSPEVAYKLESEGKALRKLLNGKVSNIVRRMIFIQPGNVDVCLDQVECNFLPKKGDMVKLKVLCAVDPESPNLSGRVLLIEQVSALRSQNVIGRVTSWRSMQGEIAPLPVDGERPNFRDERENIFFELPQCVEGYIPELGDIVIADCIESRQDILEWRAILVVKDLGSNNTRMSQNVDPEEIELLRDKAYIEISRNNSLGTVLFQSTNILKLTIRNLGKHPNSLVTVYPHPRLCSKPQFELHKCPQLPFILVTHSEYSIEFSCTARNLGASKNLFVFEFEDGVKIGRYLHVSVLGQIYEEPQSQNKPRYQRNFQPQDEVKGPVVPVQRSGMNLDPFRKRLLQYSLQGRPWKLAREPDIRGCQDAVYDILLNIYPEMHKELSFSKYKPRWHDILYIEEAETTVDLQRYDLKEVELHQHKDLTSEKFYELEVPGLAENRPSVIPNDTIHVQHILGGERFEGLVQKVMLDRLVIKFHERFQIPTESDRYNVRFRISRTQFRRMHAAIDAACMYLGPHLLFPSTRFQLKNPQVVFDEYDSPAKSKKSHSKNSMSKSRVSVSERLFQSPPSGASSREAESQSSRPRQKREQRERTRHLRKLDFVNKNLNAAQRTAVFQILLGEARPLPYIIFGPPGTGKTMTLVEAILQLHLILPDSRLLVATPSNSAADLIADRLIDSGLLMPGALVRLVAISYEDHIPPRLLPYSRALKGIGRMNSRDDDEILERIVVGTLGTLGRLVQASKTVKFTHVLVDEAGQATEPETMLVTALLGCPKQMVLAGDPMQLGPVIQGRASAMAGLDVSFLARLLYCGPYIRDTVGFPDTQGYNPLLITMLVQNYRSVPEILALPDRLFYNSELVSTVSQHHGIEASLLSAMKDDLPQRISKEGPPALVFHGVRGTCRRESDSPSWFNSAELYQALVYISALYTTGLKAEQLGVISPYVKQVQKMRGLLFSLGLPVPKVGSVEEFQGQERLAIIFSAVRSSENCEEEGLGFLANPNRMNTAITRARALLIVIGDPHLLVDDPSWRALILDCLKRDAYCGCDVPPVLLGTPTKINS